MKLGIVVYSNDPETVWNAFRLANFSLQFGDQVKMFMIGKGVEFESIGNSRFNLSEQIEHYLADKGPIYVCGTCLEMRKMEPSGLYQVATLKDLREIIAESDKIISF